VQRPQNTGCAKIPRETVGSRNWQ